jgi:hypothetical protein
LTFQALDYVANNKKEWAKTARNLYWIYRFLPNPLVFCSCRATDEVALQQASLATVSALRSHPCVALSSARLIAIICIYL